MTTTGMQRKPGVQVRLVAGSPKASKRSHLNPGFKVVSHASPRRRTFSFRGCVSCGSDLTIGRDFAPDSFVMRLAIRAPRCTARVQQGSAPHDADRTALRRELRDRRRASPAANASPPPNASPTAAAAAVRARTGYVAGYWAMDGEIALHAWQLRLPRDCTYCLPVLHEDGRLRFAPWRPGDRAGQQPARHPRAGRRRRCAAGTRGDGLVVLPLVGFDARGHRLGMGGGWYDRSFAFRQSAGRAAVAGRRRIRRRNASMRWSGADWDVALDAVCTESATCNSHPTPHEHARHEQHAAATG